MPEQSLTFFGVGLTSCMWSCINMTKTVSATYRRSSIHFPRPLQFLFKKAHDENCILILELADQVINRIVYVHTKNLRHSKPDNFLIGSGCQCYSLLILVWPDSTEMAGHGSTYYAEQVAVFSGTTWQTSISEHLGIEHFHKWPGIIRIHVDIWY